MFKTSDEWNIQYREAHSFWFHDGNMKRPHTFLPFPSMKHCNGFFNSEFIMENPRLLDEASSDLVELLMAYDTTAINVDRVVGLCLTAGLLAHSIARGIGRKRSHQCLCSIAMKKTLGHRTTAEFIQPIRMTELVLAVNDALLTEGSIGLLNEAIAIGGGYITPFVATLVNCLGITEWSNGKNTKIITKIATLINCPPIQTWAPNECPLCQGGSEVIHPKRRNTWELLNATY